MPTVPPCGRHNQTDILDGGEGHAIIEIRFFLVGHDYDRAASYRLLCLLEQS
jgi:hypothetical protein